ncbi:MAG: oxidoreductase [Candidatus Thiodiazotropha lotti]|uniref:Alcohol dehydrogenase n=1 Tax=Candidatus Thiodiazotropha endoloripes TaxID=1818881 RepID=A0A1E2UHS5_9GAMM|nr:MDR family oxidoreductase [Candidatus Thiodiazotropha endoloripes]MCG7899860.1 oxidoreductase [Candidatus Thiodiazotropha weberae]MCG7993149.1 oxidoreductase [Candidatus Thiodiazotropha lotti]MCG7903918.1 oxidoreductase [Candidatus Thiodiazotropha weberae]MCG8000755.1 oxidoreductase [Candidatus Thiodiazotropha lotti]MCW4184811.1 oxidoreductase [Candidatus Thiodiazotropha weberae]
MFKGVLIDKQDGNYSATISDIDEAMLPEGDVTIDVHYSSINYKDALAITGQSPVVRRFPMVPGIDLVGTVSSTTHGDYQTGDQVILNGWGVGEKHWGGLAQKARVNGDWLVRLPKSLQPKEAMAIGTAGYTAMLCILALERNGITPDKGDILVTGASGGVGSVTIAILAKLGYSVIALSGKAEAESAFLTELGAAEIIPSEELAQPGKPLAKERWIGVVDVVGSHVLANACASTHYGGVVTACGLAGGMDFPATVAPFILRGVSLVGIDSVMCPKEIRQQAWDRLEQDLDLSKLSHIAEEVGLSEVIETADNLLARKIRGRRIVDVNR